MSTTEHHSIPTPPTSSLHPKDAVPDQPVPRSPRLRKINQFVVPAGQQLDLAKWPMSTQTRGLLEAHGILRLDQLRMPSTEELLCCANSNLLVAGELAQIITFAAMLDNPVLPPASAAKRQHRPSKQGRAAQPGSPYLIPHCFLHNERWWVRVIVDDEILRGSSVKLWNGVMTVFDVPRHEQREFHLSDKRHISIRLSWSNRRNPQPQACRLRHVVEALGLHRKDVLWFTPDFDRIAVRHVRYNPYGEGLDQIRFLSGLTDLTDRNLAIRLSSAIGCPGVIERAELAKIFRKRRDYPIEEYLTGGVSNRLRRRQLKLESAAGIAGNHERR